MTWRLVIAFSLFAVAAPATDLRGAVALEDSRLASVRRGKDYSGVVVWLEPAGAAAPVPQRPARLTMQQKDKRFTPHVLAAQVGSVVRFPNLDPIYHSAFSNFSGQVFEVGLYPPGTAREVTFTRAGVVRIFCNIHPSMSAVIVVVKTPWFAVSDKAGAFAIRNAPPGLYRMHVFHERATAETLAAQENTVRVSADGQTLPLLRISETGYIETPHENKYGHDYPPGADSSGGYPAGTK